MISLRKHDRDDEDADGKGGEVSQGPNSFSDAETSAGGADSTYGTPDATPSARLGDDDPPEAPAAS
ncbi:hypothetical protein [uncultured Friedmanniella sp.]|uniref:hypothetical protein n=1 Tax=uncultured Friedmanniella sp. TaxID=335381 RepID=UPI0035CBB26D